MQLFRVDWCRCVGACWSQSKVLSNCQTSFSSMNTTGVLWSPNGSLTSMSDKVALCWLLFMGILESTKYYMSLWTTIVIIKIGHWNNKKKLTIIYAILGVTLDVISPYFLVRAIFHLTCRLMRDGGSMIISMLLDWAACFKRFLFVFPPLTFLLVNHNPHETTREGRCLVSGWPKPSF